MQACVECCCFKRLLEIKCLGVRADSAGAVYARPLRLTRGENAKRGTKLYTNSHTTSILATQSTGGRFRLKLVRTLYAALASLALTLLCLAVPPNAAAQGLEAAAGWTHITGNFGTDGFNFGAGWNFSPKVLVAADYDTAWDNSRIGTFDITSVGAVTSKSHLQDFMFGPRIFF